jgi:hypothetical protein
MGSEDFRFLNFFCLKKGKVINENEFQIKVTYIFNE